MDAASDPYRVHSLTGLDRASAVEGTVVWDAPRSLWNGGMTLAALTLGPLTADWDAALVCLVLGAVTLCAGHSVGYHRKMIHRSFDCPRWVERTLVWLGAAVGMGGPIWTMRTHDMRDWAQRQPDCHDIYAHRRGLLRDLWWNLHCRIRLASPPTFDPGPAIAADSFYRFVERTWMPQQILIALPLYVIGGWSWVVWGVFVRVFVCTTGHWLVTRYAHTTGPQRWIVEDSCVQGHDLPALAIPTFGECWHNNHHAFPRSARHGLYAGQLDLGWELIRLLERMGMAWDIQTPETLPPRSGVRAAGGRQAGSGMSLTNFGSS